MSSKNIFLAFVVISCSIIPVEARQDVDAPIMVFDLGNTLTTTSIPHCVRAVGIGRFARYALNGGSLSTLTTKLYTFLESAEPRTHEQHAHTVSKEPLALCHWHTNSKSPTRLKKELLAHLTTYQACETEKQILKGIITMMFTPKKYITTTILIPEMVTFIQECKQLGCKIYYLTNWEAESFDLLLKKYPILEQLADGWTVSGHHATLKPEAAIYRQLFTMHNILPENAIFLDDRPENSLQARTLGMATIEWATSTDHHPHLPDMPSVRRQFCQFLRLKAPHKLTEYQTLRRTKALQARPSTRLIATLKCIPARLSALLQTATRLTCALADNRLG